MAGSLSTSQRVAAWTLPLVTHVSRITEKAILGLPRAPPVPHPLPSPKMPKPLLQDNNTPCPCKDPCALPLQPRVICIVTNMGSVKKSIWLPCPGGIL